MKLSMTRLVPFFRTHDSHSARRARLWPHALAAFFVVGSAARPFLGASCWAGAAVAEPAGGALCADGECKPVISATTYGGRPAYRLTDGRSEAVVVPGIGRVMRFGLVGGANLLWNAVPGAEPKFGPWVNYGGDKSWLGPESSWDTWRNGGGNWPPDAAQDGQLGATAEVLTGGKLRLTTPLSPQNGVQLTREMYFDAGGDFVIEQAGRKLAGPPLRGSLWSISQVVPGQAIFLPVNSNSPYKKNYHWLSAPQGAPKVELINNRLLRLIPETGGGGYKLGVDAPVSSIVSVVDRVALAQRAGHPKGDYPDGADGAGFPVELYVNSDPRMYYAELELLSPLLPFRAGARWQHTVRWSLHALPSDDLDAPETVKAIEDILLGPPPKS